MFERVRARKTEKGVAVFMRAYGMLVPYVRISTATPQHLVDKAFYRKTLHV